jgi:murein DD-endopeptidase / murein LD-carboxypeptidase
MTRIVVLRTARKGSRIAASAHEFVIPSTMSDPRLDLSRSPIKIPKQFQGVPYNGKRYPGAPGIRSAEGGANCQRYAYEFVRSFGYKLPDFRSTDLWKDTAHTQFVKRPKPFDLVLVHRAPDPSGAHVGIYLGHGLVLHLSKKIGEPAIESLQSMMRRVQYRYLVGFKRILLRCEVRDQINSRPNSSQRRPAIAEALRRGIP